MTYIFINPVTQGMYDKRELTDFLNSNSFVQVFCEKDWISFVKKSYKNALELNDEMTFLDMRCPKAVSFVKEKFTDAAIAFPKIEPILIHCAREIAGRYSESGSVLITTPCASLAEYGNSLNLKNTRFISWNDFINVNDCRLKKNHLEASPIPPGFFTDVEKNTLSVTGQLSIEKIFRSESYKSARLVEMLFCSDGCNNGDGVL